MDEKLLNSKVYYGEYSLEYWIKLLLEGNVVLPPYQRYFVWKEEEIETFINSLKELSFAPPVIIGSFWNQAEQRQVNYIIDGQQRLTAILLAVLRIIPNPKKFKEEETEESDTAALKRGTVKKKLVWTFNKLIKSRYHSIHEIDYDKSLYNDLPELLATKELKNLRLGYAYIIPQMPDHNNGNKQQECFSKLFRNINFQGIALDKVESRRSLYFLDASYADWFDPKFLRDRGVDFIRYASLLTTFHKANAENTEVDWNNIIPARRRSKDYENFYEKYIYSITGLTSKYSQEELESLFGKFSEVFPDNDYTQYLKNVEALFNTLGLTESVLEDTIKTDLYLFGLFQYELFDKRFLDFSDVSAQEKLKEMIDQAYDTFRRSPNHRKSPNTKTYLKNRIERSLSIYENFIIAK